MKNNTSLWKIVIIVATIFFIAETFKYFFEFQEFINSKIYNWRFYFILISFLGSLFLSLLGFYGIYKVFNKKSEK